MSETLIDGSTARPAPYRGLGSEIVRWLSLAYLTLAGWKMRGDWPALEKAVLVAAPHTSNWDGLNMLATAGVYRVKLAWMGKKSLTQGPFGWVLKAMGCVPIDRAQSNDVVKVMRDAFAARTRMILAIPPEGTRSLAREWKSGFYYIAHGAGVPLVISVLDYGTKRVSLAAVVTPSGDYAEDLKLIRAHYVGVKGKHAEKFAAPSA
jgi:1-acyl-sn-glycerol-3-phosphate acyltransferase